jgi:hypothetical protein
MGRDSGEEGYGQTISSEQGRWSGLLGGVRPLGRGADKCPDLFGRGGWWMRMEEWWREGIGCGRVGDGKEEQG